jgi:hypothetical protein
LALVIIPVSPQFLWLVDQRMALCSLLRRLGGPHASVRYSGGSFRWSSTFTTPPYVHVYDFGEWTYTSAETIQFRVPYGQDRQYILFLFNADILRLLTLCVGRPHSEYLSNTYYRSLRQEQDKELAAKREKKIELDKLEQLKPRPVDIIKSLLREIRAHNTRITELGAEAGQWIFERKYLPSIVASY